MFFIYLFFSDKARVIGIAGARKISPDRYYDSSSATVLGSKPLGLTSRINQVSHNMVDSEKRLWLGGKQGPCVSG